MPRKRSDDSDTKEKHPQEVVPPEAEGQEPPQAILERSTSGDEASPESAALDAPEAPRQETLESLRTDLAEARARADEYLDGWQRALAEFANYKKRMDRDREDTRSVITGDILLRYLSVLDDLERALKDRPVGSGTDRWADGIELIYHKLQAILEAEGVETIPAEGQTFDPTLHEAVTHEQSEDHREGQVIEVLQQGYRMNDRVLRPAFVRVAK
ncbi:MAG TPA: nucleotide exchange factor GrpE [Anaerolineales bacterium]|nr:nucleotide exchange factor GrpE [Anaerolineales bacterium]HLA81749.1 nucleotide exchange factor GrpE [Thermoleophilia bacterium]